MLAFLFYYHYLRYPLLRSVTIAIFLGVVLLAPYGGQYAYLALKKYITHKKFESRYESSLTKDELQLFIIDKENSEDIEWEHEREFRFGGVMYDVIEECQLGDTTFLWCWMDEQETDLEVRIEHLLKRWLGELDFPINDHKWLDWQKTKYLSANAFTFFSELDPESTSFAILDRIPKRIYYQPPVPPPRPEPTTWLSTLC
ncbi:MAG: hypothetical protein R3275_00435 [Saprospiraceae bacterium]|nr:hypothetical protein [Saprospiraceae bacterium]